MKATIKSKNSAKAKAKANTIFNSKPNGREKEFMESIYWGVAKPYADLKDCQKAGITIKKERISPGGAYYYITKADCVKLLTWLL